MKRCSKCFIEKELCRFHKQKRGKYGHKAECADCTRSRRSKHYADNIRAARAYQAEYYANNSDAMRSYSRNRYADMKSDPGFKEASRVRAAKYYADKKYSQEYKDAQYKNNSKWRKTPKGRSACNAKDARYNAKQISATPAWADLTAIKSVYADCERITRETGISHHVDHIWPLQGKTVSGLHIEYNLQILTATANKIKGNRVQAVASTTSPILTT